MSLTPAQIAACDARAAELLAAAPTLADYERDEPDIRAQLIQLVTPPPRPAVPLPAA